MSEVEVIHKKVKLNDSNCPYISTIKRHLLDFDFEKLCSITLSNLNIYACLVCGKYYQGKAQNTHAYTHALQMSHHMFMNLKDSRIYCLPDGYEVVDSSLDDIKFNLNPQYTPQMMQKLDENIKESRALDGTSFLPGYVGLNNLNKTDYFNSVIQALGKITPLRDFMIFYNVQNVNPFQINTLLTQRFSELVRKIWNPKNYKGHVSPHELIQAVSLKSNKQFQIGKQSDPLLLLIWFLDNLKKELLWIDKKFTIIQDCFQGELEIEWFQPLRNGVGYYPEAQYHKKQFYYLNLDLPSSPLSKDQNEKMTSIPIQNLLKKYDGFTNTDDSTGRKRFKITKFPKFLIVHMKRFVKNNFFLEKNSLIVTFPLNNLDLNECWRVDPQIKQLKYNLVANICHEGNEKVGVYKVHIKNKANDQWYQIQDLHKQPILPQLISVSEAYLQIYELQE